MSVPTKDTGQILSLPLHKEEKCVKGHSRHSLGTRYEFLCSESVASPPAALHFDNSSVSSFKQIKFIASRSSSSSLLFSCKTNEKAKIRQHDFHFEGKSPRPRHEWLSPTLELNISSYATVASQLYHGTETPTSGAAWM